MTFKILLAILEKHTRRFYIVAKPRSDGYPEISKQLWAVLGKGQTRGSIDSTQSMRLTE